MFLTSLVLALAPGVHGLQGDIADLRPEGTPRAVRSMVDTAEDPRDVGRILEAGIGPPPGTVTGFNPIPLVGGGPIGPWIGGGSRPWSVTYVLTGLGTGFQEVFFLQLPKKVQPGGSPLLLFFHKYGSKQNDVNLHTSFGKECAERDWFLFSALGASKQNFGSLQSQANTEAALDYVLSAFGGGIDRDRLYGVGFSMGGGAMASFAARHLDPAGPRIAAMVDHTGGVALKNTWTDDAPVQWVLEYWFGGTPLQKAFEYERCSTLVYDPVSFKVDLSRSLAVNLAHIPTYIVNASADPLQYLVVQSQLFREALKSVGGTVLYESVPAAQHDWATLDETKACDFLAQFSLQVGSSGEVLADRDGRWHWFEIVQGQAGAHTRFEWIVEKKKNRIQLRETSNLQRCEVDLLSAGLRIDQPVLVRLSAADGVADLVVLDGLAATPQVVTRDGQVSSNWIWDGAAQELTLLETDPGVHQWLVTP